jgi:VWFA-related protein
VFEPMNIARIMMLSWLGIEAQTPPPPSLETDSSIRVSVEVVNVLATVYDGQGVLKRDLNREDFQIRENGIPQQIRYFAQDTDLPLTIALLIDVSGSVNRILPEEKATAGQFLERILRPTDQALLMGFSSTIILWQDFTSSPASLSKSLEKLRAVPQRGLPVYGSSFAGTMLYDSVYVTAHRKLKDVTGRKAMVIISDGVDNGSETELKAAVQALEDTNTVAYGICFEPPDSRISGCSYLKDLSVPTGGRSYKVTNKTPLSKIFQVIEDEIRSQYAIGYVSSNPAHDGTYRRLDVRTRKGNFKVRTRKGYYAAK